MSNMNALLSLLFLLCTASSTKLQEIPGLDTPYHPQTEKHQKSSQKTFDSFSQDGYHLLKSGSEMIIRSEGIEKLEIFCYEGETPKVANLLKTVELRITIGSDNFKYYHGSNASAVKNLYKESSWFSFTPWKPTSFRLNLYNNSCIGIETKESFRVALVVRHVDFWRVLALCVGIALFCAAPLLAHNVVFHYATGVSIGIFGSLLVIVFIISRNIPKKTGALSVLIGGWGLVLYFVQYLWVNCLTMFKEYSSLIAGYVCLVGILSFALVYRYGPLTDQRSISLVQWALQLVALALMFFSCQCREVTLALIIIILVHYNIPSSWKNYAKNFKSRYFPPKPQLLTEEEYLEQSHIETKKSLEELRKFCHSPECNSWKVMSRLKTPQRFAEFVEGASHLSDDEILSYEDADHHRYSGTAIDPYLTSDEEDEAANNAS